MIVYTEPSEKVIKIAHNRKKRNFTHIIENSKKGELRNRVNSPSQVCTFT